MNETSGISVSELNLLVAEAIRREPRIRSVTVRGEVSSFRHYLSSGHWYFSLKDEEAAVSCVMFRQNTFRARMKPRDGDRVLVSGYVDVYPKNGTYQLYAMSLRPDGTGDLFQKFEELKQRLFAEGLFDPARKRILPMVPQKVATANEQTDADVIIVARGGGSAEDLWCFNEEIVARAVAGSRIPVVSGVGHEIDTTICDLAADVRASTPSNAAEIVFPDRKELRSRTEKLKIGLIRAAEGAAARCAAKVKEAALRLSTVSPETRIVRLSAASSLSRTRLVHAIRNRIGNALLQTGTAGSSLAASVNQRTESAKTAIALLRQRLEALNPLLVLERGYALVSDREGRVLTGKREAETAQDIRIRFADGTVEAKVMEERSADHE